MNHLLVSCDYAQAELCSLAQVCIDKFGFSEMGRLINEGIDLHLYFVHKMTGRSYEDLLKNKKDPEVKQQRQAAKCFHPDTEVLTRTGWIRLVDLQPGVEVAAARMGDNFKCDMQWEVPTRLTTRKADTLVHLKNEGIDLLVTPDHRMAAWRAGGNAYQPRPDALRSARYWPNAGTLESEVQSPDLGLLRLAVAVQADGSYTPTAIRLGFKKCRKITRLQKMLEGRQDWKQVQSAKGVTTFTLAGPLATAVKNLLDADKTMPWSWVSLSLKARMAVLDEARFWDSHSFPKGTAYSFCSYIPKNLDVLQAIASISGRKTACRPGNKLTVRDNRMSRGENLGCTAVPYAGDVYCLTVPSDAVLVRYNGVPVITHQCANFGYPGGLGTAKFVDYALVSYGVELDEAQAKEMKNVWLETYPEMKLFFRWISNRLSVAEYTTIIQHRSGRARGRTGYTDGCNTLFQGLTADGASHAINMLNREAWLDRNSPMYGARMVGFFYDEFFGSIPDRGPEANHWAALRICDVMRSAMQEFTPDVVARVEPAMMRNWSKAAEPVYNAEGFLLPWEDRIVA